MGGGPPPPRAPWLAPSPATFGGGRDDSPSSDSARATPPQGYCMDTAQGKRGERFHDLACCLKNLTMAAGASAGNWWVPGWMKVTTGAPIFDGYSVHHFPHSLPSPHWLSWRSMSMVALCQANLTSGSFSPATCITGAGFSLPRVLAAAADDGAKAANCSPRAAQSR